MSAGVPVTSCDRHNFLQEASLGELAPCLPDEDNDQIGEHDDTTNAATPSGITEKAEEYFFLMLPGSGECQ